MKRLTITDNRLRRREDHIPLDQVSLFRAGFENPFAPITFLFRRTAYEAVGPFNQDYTVLGDWDFHYRFH